MISTRLGGRILPLRGRGPRLAGAEGVALGRSGRRRMALGVLSFVCCLGAWASPNFPARVVSSSGLGAGFYSNPLSVLGPPTTASAGIRLSLGFGAFGSEPSGLPVVTTIPTGGQITVEFEPPVQDDPKNPYGRDFIIFGNGFVGLSQQFAATTLADQVTVTGGPDFFEPMRVSVSPDGLTWYGYPLSLNQGADGFAPTQADRWNPVSRTWGPRSNFHLPIPPAVTRAGWTGKTLAEAIASLQGSAGGTALDLAPSGFRWIRFIKIEGGGGEVDAISRVLPAFESRIRSGRLRPVGNLPIKGDKP